MESAGNPEFAREPKSSIDFETTSFNSPYREFKTPLRMNGHHHSYFNFKPKEKTLWKILPV